MLSTTIIDWRIMQFINNTWKNKQIIGFSRDFWQAVEREGGVCGSDNEEQEAGTPSYGRVSSVGSLLLSLKLSSCHSLITVKYNLVTKHVCAFVGDLVQCFNSKKDSSVLSRDISVINELSNRPRIYV